MKGRVKWFNQLKGYGFIKADGGEDVFVHLTGLFDKSKRDLMVEEAEVEFEMRDGKKGPAAYNVVVLAGA